MLYEYEKYLTTPENIRVTLDKFGVAIIPKVLDAAQIKTMNDGAWAMLEAMTSKFDVPLVRDAPETYASFYELQPNRNMLFKHLGVGHAQYVWDLRQNAAIADIFAKLWHCKPEDLHTSFDGLSFALPPELLQPTAGGRVRGYHVKDWMHCDQSFRTSDLVSVQSWVSGVDVQEGDGTLAVLEGSHTLHRRFATEVLKTPASDDWYKLEPEEVAWYHAHGCPRVSIRCGAGDLVLWDSRTIHCGQGPLKGRATKNFRHVVYVCMTPKKVTPPAIRKKRIAAFEKRRMTSHVPFKCRLTAPRPHTYGKPLADIVPCHDDVKLTALGRSLVGYD